jgi:hypothetical protein
MAYPVRLVVVLSMAVPGIGVLPHAQGAATPKTVINNVEEKVNGEGPRGEARHQDPDVSAAGWAVWWDNRGSSTKQIGDSLWAKNLSTHTETRVTTLTTATSFPRISGSWMVWEDMVGGNRDVLARQLPPTGPVITVANDAVGDGFPSIDGTQVVWEKDNFLSGNIDLYMRDLTGGAGGTLGPIRLVTDDPGDQVDPDISGNAVTWTDRSGAIPRVMGRVMSATPSAEFAIAEPAEGAEDAAISGNRVVWTVDSDPLVVTSCVLGAGASGCTDPAQRVWTSNDAQSEPEVSGSRVVWLEDPGGPGSPAVWYRDLSVAGTNLPKLIDAPVGGANGSGPSADRMESPKIDGSLLVWTANGFRGPDIFWKDVTTSALPARANSIGLGRFPDQIYPSASTSYVTYLSDSGDFNPRNAVWATDLTGDRRVLRVSTFADFGTAISPPKIAGNRIFWSDSRDTASGSANVNGSNELGPNVFHRDLPDGDETRVTTAGIGDHPSVSGDEVGWLCRQWNSLCIERAGAITRIPLPVADGYTIDQQVRVSGNVGVWSEFQIDWTDQGPNIIDSRLHAIDLTTGEDEVLGSGSSKPGFIPSYGLSGGNAAWLGQDDSGGPVIYRNTVSFPCGGSCDRSGSASLLFPAGDFSIGNVTVDATRVAWAQTESDYRTNVWLKDVTAATDVAPTQVTTGGTAAGEVALFGDYVYWTDNRAKGSFCDPTTFGCDIDIYREYIGSGTPPAPLPADTSAPAGVSRITATVSGSAIRVSWTNPITPDLAGVIVLRKTVPLKGKAAVATGMDDPNATIVYDGTGTSFLDTDVAPSAATYTYTAFTYDEVPNYSAGVATR